MTYTEIIMTAISAVLLIINLLSIGFIIAKSNKFKKQDIVLKLYGSFVYTAIFTFISLCIIISLLYFYKIDIYSFILSVALLSGIAHILFAQISVCGITKQALYVNGKILEWHNIYDYYIDKNKKIVIFSSNVKGGLTLKGLTKPLRYDKNDEEKLEKFLESHKSKYFNKIIIR